MNRRQIPFHLFASSRYRLVPALVTTLVLAGCAAAPPEPAKTPNPATVDVSATPAAPKVIEQAQTFEGWVTEFKITARKAGIDAATLHQAFDNVRFLSRVVELDRAQPEFTRTVWDYLDNTVSTQRIARGREKLLEHQSHIEPIAARYGVPPEVLVAIWGMESSYGTYTGDVPTIDALATLGFEGRREAWARGQLLAALRILQNRDIDRAHLIGSWAGAMGQTQFLPTSFLAHAVDADGDGRRDIWGSLPDVMASTANFLAKSGWQTGQPWGIEVYLPPGFDYTHADVRRPTAQWIDKGVQAADGTALPVLADGSILLPAGARGPAFLVGANFRTVLRYNNSTSYALAVSLLAQQLIHGPGVYAPWPRDLQALTRIQVVTLQTALNTRGFHSGTPDGIMGPATQSGVRQYQSSVGLPADGYPTMELLQRLQ